MVPVDEVDEIRIVASWVADGELPELALDPEPGEDALLGFVGRTTAPPAPARQSA